MNDVPSPIDFHDPAQARAWAEDTAARRPWRPAFFNACAAELSALERPGLRVIELGSGPGMLAERLLQLDAVAEYTLLDFSEAMHTLARERIGAQLHRTHFVTRDFRESAWSEGLGHFDAVITLQAAHEMRHKRHLPALLRQARSLLPDGGLLLYCDHYTETNSSRNPDLFATRSDQPLLLAAAGFRKISCLRDEGGMALYRGVAA